MDCICNLLIPKWLVLLASENLTCICKVSSKIRYYDLRCDSIIAFALAICLFLNDYTLNEHKTKFTCLACVFCFCYLSLKNKYSKNLALSYRYLSLLNWLLYIYVLFITNFLTVNPVNLIDIFNSKHIIVKEKLLHVVGCFKSLWVHMIMLTPDQVYGVLQIIIFSNTNVRILSRVG